MVTTIQISESVKEKLSKLKSKKNETYEEVIENLLKEYSKKDIEEALIKGYKENHDLNLQIVREFEHSDRELDRDWEW